MKTVSFTCDRCGRNAAEFVRMTKHHLIDAYRHDAHDVVERDLCEECASELDDWLMVSESDAGSEVD